MRKIKYRPKLDPERDLQGATPESLARALFRSRHGGGAAACRELNAKKVETGKPGASGASS